MALMTYHLLNHSLKLKKSQANNFAAQSPQKRIMYRTECLNQLDKWHGLLEKGVISKAQFDELQGTILNEGSMEHSPMRFMKAG